MFNFGVLIGNVQYYSRIILYPSFLLLLDHDSPVMLSLQKCSYSFNNILSEQQNGCDNKPRAADGPVPPGPVSHRRGARVGDCQPPLPQAGPLSPLILLQE